MATPPPPPTTTASVKINNNNHPPKVAKGVPAPVMRLPAPTQIVASGGNGVVSAAGGNTPTSSRKPLPAPRPGRKQQKCILKLDGYSYMIVASPPEKKCTKDDSDIRHPVSTPTSRPPSRNGQLSRQTSGLTIVRSAAFRKSALMRSSRVQSSVDELELDQLDLASDNFPQVDSAEACDKASLRLRSLLHQMRRGDVPFEVLQRNIRFAVQVLESICTYDDQRDLSQSFDDSSPHVPSVSSPVPLPVFKPRKLLPPSAKRFSPRHSRKPTEDEDDLSEVQPDAVPPEVREWLASTFTRQLHAAKRKTDEKPKFRSVANAIRAGIFVERIYRRMSSSSMLQFPPEVVALLKSIDEWSFDVFVVSEVSNNQPIRYIGYDLLNRYGIISKFKISPSILENFLNAVEMGYCRHGNPYHNNVHAADVTQTVHFMLCQTGLMHWLTDLEIFATIVAALIHDFEHTGTTNNFHVNSGSEYALLYNDRAVLENHHVSAAFRLLKEDEKNIVSNLSREEFMEFRGLVIDQVLATDMSCHFQQLKIMKGLLALPEFSLDKSKALSMVLHCCDISHPGKQWALHFRWTKLLLEEFFQQGDKEQELGLAYSPLCDRNNTHIADSQIGFIDFIVEPSMSICADMLERVMATMQSNPKGGLDMSIAEEDPSKARSVNLEVSVYGSVHLGRQKSRESTAGQRANELRATSSLKSVIEPRRSRSDDTSLSFRNVQAAGRTLTASQSVPGSSSSDVSVGASRSVESTPPPSPRGPGHSMMVIKKPWITHLAQNKAQWRDRAAAGINGFSSPQNSSDEDSGKIDEAAAGPKPSE